MEREIELEDEERIFELIKSSLEFFKGPNLRLINDYLAGKYDSSTFERKSFLLGTLLDKEQNYNLESKLNNLRFSHGLKENRYSNVIKDIMKDLKKEQIGDSDLLIQFFRKLDDYLETIKQKQIIEYKLIFPVNLKFKDGIPIEFLHRNKDLNIKIMPKIDKTYLPAIREYINQEYPIDKIAERNEKVRKLLRTCESYDMNYFVVDCHSRNVDFAVKKASEDLEANLGLYLFTQLGGRSVMYFDLGPFPSEHSITKVRMPVVFVIEGQKCKYILFTYYEKFTSSQYTTIQDLRYLVELLSFIKKIKSFKLQQLIIEVFSYYYNALISAKYSVAFMNFWNIIEKLFFKSKDLSLKELIKRLKSTYPEGTKEKKDMEQLIDILFRKRNLYVHESKDTITLKDRDYLKSIVEHVIETILKLSGEFDSIGMLDFFYQNLGKPLRIIKNEFKILNLISKLKGNGK